MRGALLLFALTVPVCLAQSDASPGFVNQRLLQHLHLMPPTSQRSELPPVRVLPQRVQPLAPPPCVRIPPQERMPVPENFDSQMVVPTPGLSIDQKMVIQLPPACPEP